MVGQNQGQQQNGIIQQVITQLQLLNQQQNANQPLVNQQNAGTSKLSTIQIFRNNQLHLSQSLTDFDEVLGMVKKGEL